VLSLAALSAHATTTRECNLAASPTLPSNHTFIAAGAADAAFDMYYYSLGCRTVQSIRMQVMAPAPRGGHEPRP
jgi:hypothetical protein